MTIKVTDHLDDIKRTHGEDAWKAEIRRLAAQGVQAGPKHEAFWKELTKGYDWLDWDAFRQEITGADSVKTNEQMMADLIKQQMPGIKSQAQYDAVVGALDALQLTLNAILEGSANKEGEARKALDMTFTVLAKATELAKRLEDVPESASSKAAEAFRPNLPSRDQEHLEQKQLLTELAAINSLDGLNAWYAETKERRDKVITQELRNHLLDSIRAKKTSLG